MLSDDDMMRIIRESYSWYGGELIARDRQLIRAIEREVRQQALEDAAQWFLNEDNKHTFFSETLWPHQVAERLRALKDQS